MKQFFVNILCKYLKIHIRKWDIYEGFYEFAEGRQPKRCIKESCQSCNKIFCEEEYPIKQFTETHKKAIKKVNKKEKVVYEVEV